MQFVHRIRPNEYFPGHHTDEKTKMKTLYVPTQQECILECPELCSPFLLCSFLPSLDTHEYIAVPSGKNKTVLDYNKTMKTRVTQCTHAFQLWVSHVQYLVTSSRVRVVFDHKRSYEFYCNYTTRKVLFLFFFDSNNFKQWSIYWVFERQLQGGSHVIWKTKVACQQAGWQISKQDSEALLVGTLAAGINGFVSKQQEGWILPTMIRLTSGTL